MGARRIICLTTSYPLEAGSSSGVFVARLAEALNRSRPVTVVTPAYRSLSGSIAAPLPVRAFRYAPARWQTLCHVPGGIPAALRASRALRLLVPSLLIAMLLETLSVVKRGDIIQANWAVCGAVAALAARLTGARVVTTLRGADVNSAKTSLVSRLLLKAALRGSAAVVAVSEDIGQLLDERRFAGAEKVSVIANGVDERFLSVGRARQCPDAAAPLSLITVGSLIPRKNVGFLLRALPELPHGCRLTVVGEGPLAGELQAQARALGVVDRVVFAGNAAPEDVPELLARHDVFVLASASEGRSNAVYEAMAAAMAVVASDIAGTREQITSGHNGHLFAPESVAGFVEVVSRLHADRGLLIETGRRAHQWILDNELTWDAAAGRYQSLFDAVERGAR